MDSVPILRISLCQMWFMMAPKPFGAVLRAADLDLSTCSTRVVRGVLVFLPLPVLQLRAQ